MKLNSIILSIFFLLVAPQLIAYENNFSIHALDNHIPVIIKRDATSRIITLKIVVEGLSSFLKPDQSGVESVLFTMMTKGSKKYDYKYIQSLLYQKQAAFSSDTNQNGSTLTLTVIDKYFDDFYPIFVDGFIAPHIHPSEFSNVMEFEKQQLFDEQNTPFSLLQYTIRQNVYKNHPFETSSKPTPQSISNIDLLQVKRFHEKVLNANRITIIATGNFDAKTLLPRLNDSFSFIKPSPVTQLALKKTNTKGSPILIKNEAAKNTGFLARTFASPSVREKDYVPAIIAATIFQELLFNIVREKYGACYSIGTNIAPSKSGYGLLYVYRASNINAIPSYIAEAEAILLKDQVISGKESDGTYKFQSISDRLDGFKNTQINALFSMAKTNAGVASQIASGLFLLNEHDYYLTIIQKIKDVTSTDVLNAFKKYWLGSDRQWFIITGDEDSKKIKLENFSS
ncbi:MAG: M16 family metallopeptidase [Treponemataceae bacterium]